MHKIHEKELSFYKFCEIWDMPGGSSKWPKEFREQVEDLLAQIEEITQKSDAKLSTH